MTKPPRKSKTIDQYFSKKGLLSVKRPPKKTKPLAHADKPSRKPNKRKPIPQVENQGDVKISLFEENESTELDIVPNETIITDDVVIGAQSSPLSSQPAIIDDISVWINSAKLFDDILPIQWYFQWRWVKILNNLDITPCLWQQSTPDISILKIMYGTLQALLSVTTPEFIP
jgi:hypothetical protein